MGRKIVSRARQARLNYAAHLGRDVSIQEVATAIGISRAALSKIEKNQAMPNHETLAALCNFYGLSVGDLLVYEDVTDSLTLPLAA